MTKTLITGEGWLDQLLPNGIPMPSSTLISGPGGTGKPLVEFAFVSAWLKSGGSVIGMPLQYPTGEMVKTAMYKLYGMDMDEYKGKVAYVQLDPSLYDVEPVSGDTLKANLVKPGVWKQTISMAEEMLDETDNRNVMVFGSALNLLLFSDVHKERLLADLRGMLQNDNKRSYFFAVSTSALVKDIKRLEQAADNLMYTRMEEDMKLFFRIERMRYVDFKTSEVNVPISEDMLKEIRKVATSSRKRLIKEIKKVA